MTKENNLSTKVISNHHNVNHWVAVNIKCVMWVVTVVIYLPRDCDDITSRLTQVSFTTYNTVDKLY